LPAQLDAEQASADYRDGVLTLKLSCAASEKPRSVSIN
jgi:HSP20 family molecular chaperone IbpA